jgi:hypothetical protein
MSHAHLHIDRDILVPHDGIYSLDVHMNSDTVSAAVGKVANCLKEFMTMVCQVFGTVDI